MHDVIDKKLFSYRLCALFESTIRNLDEINYLYENMEIDLYSYSILCEEAANGKIDTIKRILNTDIKDIPGKLKEAKEKIKPKKVKMSTADFLNKYSDAKDLSTIEIDGQKYKIKVVSGKGFAMGLTRNGEKIVDMLEFDIDDWNNAGKELQQFLLYHELGYNKQSLLMGQNQEASRRRADRAESHMMKNPEYRKRMLNSTKYLLSKNDYKPYSTRISKVDQSLEKLANREKELADQYRKSLDKLKEINSSDARELEKDLKDYKRKSENIYNEVIDLSEKIEKLGDKSDANNLTTEEKKFLKESDKNLNILLAEYQDNEDKIYELEKKIKQIKNYDKDKIDKEKNKLKEQISIHSDNARKYEGSMRRGESRNPHEYNEYLKLDDIGGLSPHTNNNEVDADYRAAKKIGKKAFNKANREHNKKTSKRVKDVYNIIYDKIENQHNNDDDKSIPKKIINKTKRAIYKKKTIDEITDRYESDMRIRRKAVNSMLREDEKNIKNLKKKAKQKKDEAKKIARDIKESAFDTITENIGIAYKYNIIEESTYSEFIDRLYSLRIIK